MLDRNTSVPKMASLSIGILLLISVLVPIAGAFAEDDVKEQSEEATKELVEDDEWVIEEVEYLNGTEKDEFSLDRNIVIDGGRLEINNATLTLLIDGFHPWNITLENGGELKLWNSTIRTQPPDDLLRPFLKTKVTAMNSSIVLQHGSSFKFPGWVQLENSELTMEESSFEALDNIPDYDYTWGYGDEITGLRDNENCPMLIAEQNSEVLMMDSEINDYYTNTALSRMDWYASNTDSEDDTGEDLGNLSETGADYSVGANETMHLNEWTLDEEQMDFPAENYPYLNPIDRITALYLEADYDTEDNFTEDSELQYYNGTAWEKVKTIDGSGEDIEKSIWNIDLDQFDRDESEDRFVYDLKLRFKNEQDSGVEDAAVNFGNIKLVSAYENDIRIKDSEMTVINSYIDVDFSPSDIDPRATNQPTTPETYLMDSNPQHRVIRVYDSDFKAYGLEVTGEHTPDGDPPIVETKGSTSEIYRWAHVKAVDETEKPIDGAEIDVDFDLTADHQEAIDYGNRNYPGEYDNGTYLTGKRGFSTLILKSDELAFPESWPNGDYYGSYKLDGAYTDDIGDDHTTSKHIGLSSFPNLTAEGNHPQYDLQFDMKVPLPDLNVGAGDLTVDGSVDPGELVVERKTEIGLTVSNDGNKRAENIDVEFSLGDKVIAGSEIAKIEDGAEEDLKVDWTPQEEDLGPQTLTAVVDPDNEIEEREIDNREISIDMTIVEKPDLSVENIFIQGDFYEDGKARQGEEIGISADVTNTGGIGVDDVTVKVEAGGEMIGNETVSLSPNEVISTSSFSWTVPTDTEEYELFAEIDPESDVDESDESNNWETRYVDVVSDPVIKIENFNIDSEDQVWVGDTVTIETTVKNQGGWRSEALEVTYYVDYDSGTEEEINSIEIQGLEGGQASQTVSTTWTAEIHENIDASSQDRSITVTVSEIGEDSLSDTATSDPFTIEEVMALEITDVSVNPSVVTEGENVIVTATVENVGDVYAENFTLTLYLDDTEIAQDHSQLGIGADMNFEFEWKAELGSEEDRRFKLEISEAEPELSRDPDPREVSVTVQSKPDLEFSEMNWMIEGEDVEAKDSLNLTERDELTFNGTVENNGETPIEGASAQFIFPDGTRKNISIDVGAGESVNVRVDWTVKVADNEQIIMRLRSAEQPDATTYEELTQEVDIDSLVISLSDLNYPEEGNPGEAYSFSGVLSRDSDGKNLADTTVRVSIENSDGEEITSGSATTDQNGEFLVQLNMPEDSGDYTVLFEPETSETQSIERSISVDEGDTTTEGIMGIPWWLLVVIIAAAAGGAGSLVAYLKFFGPEEVVECGNCGASIPADSTTCPKCGVEFDMNTVKCSECGEWIPADSDTCPECGAEFIKTGEEVEDYAERMRKQYEKFVMKQKQEAEDRLGRDLSKQEFLRWWKKQPSFVTFDDWLERKEAQRKEGGQECPNCGTLNSIDAGVCQKCGASLIEVEIAKEKGTRRREEEMEEEMEEENGEESTESTSSPSPTEEPSEKETTEEETEKKKETKRRGVKKKPKKKVKKKVVKDSDED